MDVTLSFEPPRYKTLKELVAHVVHSCGRPTKHVADDLGMSSPELTQIISGTARRRFPLEKLSTLIEATAPVGYLIIYWLISRHLADKAARKDMALSRLEAMISEMMREIEELRQ